MFVLENIQRLSSFESLARLPSGHKSDYYSQLCPELDDWMDDLRFYVLFNSISVISGRWADDNEWLCVMGRRLRLRKFRLERGSNPGLLDQ